MKKGHQELGTAAGDRLMGVEEAAEFLGIAIGTLYNWSSQERIPKVQLSGKALRFRRSTLERFIDQRERPARRR